MPLDLNKLHDDEIQFDPSVLPDKGDELSDAWKAAGTVHPDDAARAVAYGRRTGVHPQAVLDSPDLKAQAAYPIPDLSQLKRTNPGLAQFLANPRNAALARDDVESLGAVERVWRLAMENVVRASAGNRLGELYHQKYVQGQHTPQVDSEIAHLKEQSQGTLVPRNWWEEAIGSAANFLTQRGLFLWEAVDQGLEGAMVGGGAAAIAGQLGPQVALPEEIVTVPAAAMVGFTAGMAGGSADYIAKVEAGHAAAEFVEKHGLEPSKAAALGNAVGFVNALLEQAQIGQLVKTVPGGRELLSQGLRKGVAAALGKKSFVEALGRATKSYGTYVGQEVTEEVLQDLTREVAAQTGRLMEGKADLKGALEGLAAQVPSFLETARSTALGVGLLGVPGHVMQIQSYRRVAPNAPRLAEAVQKAHQEGKLGQREPEAMEEFIETVRDKAQGPERVYVPAGAIDELYQMGELDPMEVSEALAALEIGDQEYQEALALGTNVNFPTKKMGRLMSGPVGEALKDKLTFAPPARTELTPSEIRLLERRDPDLPEEEMFKLKAELMNLGRPEQEAELTARLMGARARRWATDWNAMGRRVRPADYFDRFEFEVPGGGGGGDDQGRVSVGSATRIHGGDSSLPGVYVLVEAGDLITSHDPVSFKPSEGYPEGVQERRYDAEQDEQLKVVRHAQNLNTRYVITDNPDAVNGPPIITPGGVVLGGNSRAMSISRAYGEEGNGDAYRQDLEARAPIFGLDPEQVRAMREPVLARMTQPAESVQELHRLASLFNRAPTQAMGETTATASMGHNVSQATLERIGSLLAQHEATLRELLANADVAKRILQRLVNDGVISQEEANKYWSERFGQLNEDGKRLVERTVLGAILQDAELIENLPRSVLANISRSLPSLVKIMAVGGQWDIMPALREALGITVKMQATGIKSVRELARQQALPGAEEAEMGEQAAVLAMFLQDNGPNQVRDAFAGYAQDAALAAGGQQTIIKLTPEESFANWFGGPEAELFQYAGEEAATAAHDQLEKAISMEAEGADKEEIRAATGWFKGMDNIWRFEIDDSKASFKEHVERVDDWDYEDQINLGMVINHPDLFAAYPSIADVPTAMRVHPVYAAGGQNGSLSARGIRVVAKDYSTAFEILIHEIQHWIQRREGFARGGHPVGIYRQMQADIKGLMEEVEQLNKLLSEAVGTPEYPEIMAAREKVSNEVLELEKDADEKAFGIYQRLAGEVEARDTARRRNYTKQLRAKTPPENREDAIVLWEYGELGRFSLYQTEGPFGPVFAQLKGQPEQAIAKLMAVQTGEVPGAFHHPELGDIDLVWGRPGDPGNEYRRGFGLAHILAKHGEDILPRLPEIMETGKVTVRHQNRVYIETEQAERAVIRLDWNRQNKTWLLTAFARTEKAPPSGGTSTFAGRSGEQGVPSPQGEPSKNNLSPAEQKSKDLDELFQDVKVPGQGSGEQVPKASVRFDDDDKAIVKFFQAADLTSAPHEIVHVWRRELEELALDPASTLRGYEHVKERLRADWEAACKFVGAEVGKPWTRAQEEKFAEAGIDYLQTGTPPSKATAGIFARMKSWFIQMYGALKDQDKVGPEMAGVFDRLIATEREIEAAQAEAEIAPMLAEAPPGVSPEAWLFYKRQGSLAAEDSAARIAERRLGALKRLMPAWRQQSLEDARAHPGQEIMAEVVELGGFVSGEVKDLLGEAEYKALMKKRPRLIKHEGSVSLEEYAAGRNLDPRELLGQLLATPTIGELQEAWLAKKTAEFDAEMTALEVGVGPEFLELLKAEQDMLAPGSGKAADAAAALQGGINERAAGVSTSELDRRDYNDLVAAMKDAATKAVEHYRAGRNAQAAQEKARQRAAADKIRERARARQEIAKAKEALDRAARLKPFDPQKGSGVDWDFLQQIRQLVGRFRNLPISFQARSDTPPLGEFLEGLKTNQEFAEDLIESMPEVPGSLESAQDWVDLKNIVKQLAHLGRQRGKLVWEGNAMTLEGAVLQMTKHLGKYKKHPIRKGWEELQDGKGRFKGRFRRAVAEMIKTEFLLRRADHWKHDGPFQRLIMHPIKKAEDYEFELGEHAFGRLKEIFEAIPLGERKGWRTRNIKIDGVPVLLNMEEVVMIGLNSGNSGNLRALKQSTSEHHAWLADPEAHQAVLNHLDERHWEMIQNIWALLDEFFPLLDETHHRMTGVHLVKVEPIKVQTRFGEIEGGYFPIISDPKFSPVTEAQQEAQAAKDYFAAVYGATSTRAGATHERTGSRQAPMLKLGTINQHLRSVLHDISHRPAVRDVQKVITHPVFREQFSEALGQESYKELRPWLQHIARPEYHRLLEMENWLDTLRRNATLVSLGLKATVSLKQGLSLTQTIDEVGLKWVRKGLARWMSNPAEATAFAQEASPALRNRSKTWDREAIELVQRVSPSGAKLKQQTAQVIMWPIRMVDLGTTTVTWLAGYEKAVAMGMTEHQAADFADGVMRTTQPAAGPKDLAAIYRKPGLWRILTMFQSFFSSFTNRAIEKGYKLAEGELGAWEGARAAWLLMVLPVFMAYLIDEQDIPDEADDYKDLGVKTVGYLLGGVPVIRDMWTAATGPWGYAMSPVQDGLETFSDLIKLGGRLAGGEDVAPELLAKKAVLAMGYALGLPARQMITTARGLAALAQGKTDSPLAPVLGPGREDK
ncbi:MAG: hypothetical protein K9K66_04470 [Desulfarculaceae bacterium]|nr:hypothetical protein [Desulfarculaceae bacterium]MCF8073298.1 hypothetical protein [Desulfarculaceae bacterium]MCF8100894.1 hypothetical protein [Desulfarculaceae bacterium]MCF8116650.1 hypothetical protein [Desulfarculaceae bacterium]